MTELDSSAPGTFSPKRARATHTIYRDTPLANRAARAVTRPLRMRFSAPVVLPDERASGGILLALGALTLPVVAYSFTQLWSLLAGGSLAHAIRAFLP